ncbi:MAG: hypothetical protein IPL65_10850 [Lewinellaceae bacterium]|nr:hypothetical protein [Lewinellaceae bacterium]
MKYFFTSLIWCCLALGLSAQSTNYFKEIRIRSIGPGMMSGRITSICCDPTNKQVIYAGAASGGVWRSTSGGTNWEPIFDKAPTQSVGSIAVNPHNPDEIWVGTGEGNPRNSQNFGAGIFKSIDGGETWTCMGLENTHTIYRIIIHRDDPNTVFVASLGSTNGPNAERGVFKTTDGGKNWRKVLFVNDLTGCAELIADPSNPNKLFAAMWEYQRWPWFFKSGGKGSGLYVTYDGGENWQQRTSKDGLPEGELGRMGLAISKANPDVVYALVEAEENAMYKSTDGGIKWKKAADKNMGDRPFYYAEIYADPSNENVVYSVHTQVTRSIDGGQSFDSWVSSWRIHPDHHALWIDPNDPKHIIDGNDGGLNITYDGGDTWRYAENIPVGQFYHINVDNEIPYNIYGGLQDNGTVVGPSAVWKYGGLRNSEWQEVNFGDGFDAMPQRDNSRYCFAMSQGGELSYIDRQTGNSRYIKPLHPDGLNLRWNWNAALAQDPFNDHGLYFGSQYLHYSPDLGHSWQLLSPDLTTNDTSKLHQDISGGLTIDATNAENYCTIVSIAPSPKDKQVIWVGTDDGNLQLTRDGGKTWENLNDRLPDFPKNAWIPQIEVSATNAGEAFVVLNNYRQNDWQPYLYHTTDFGRKWKRLASANSVEGFCLSVVQDLEVPGLLFLGTDRGLYYSINYGKTWTKWPNEDFPSVPVQDMKIHPRDGDLVIGTYGRAIWIMDNLVALREQARLEGKLFDQPFKVFTPQPAVLAAFISYNGPHYPANATYVGENKGTQAMIPMWIKPVKKEDEADKKDKKEEPAARPQGRRGGGGGRMGGGGRAGKASIVVLSMQGDTLRQWKTNVDTAFTAIFWGLDTKGVSFPSNREDNNEDGSDPGGGPRVLPGNYKIVVSYNKMVDSTVLKVIEDPRFHTPTAVREAEAAALRGFYPTVDKAKATYDRLVEAEKNIKLVETAFVNVPDSTKKAVLKLGSAVRDSISAMKDEFFTQKPTKGIQRNPNTLNGKLWTAISYINNSEGAPNGSAQVAISEAEKAVGAMEQKVNSLFDGPWKEFRAQAEAVQPPLFKD